MAFQIQILSVRGNDNEDRALTINHKPETGNYTVVGRLIQVDCDAPSIISQKVAKGFEDKNGGGRVTMIMSEAIANELKAQAEIFYADHTTPFVILTLETQVLVAPQWNDQYGFNMTMQASAFNSISKAPYTPSELDDIESDVNLDAAYHSAKAYAENQERRQQMAALQNEAATAMINQTQTKKRGRKAKTQEVEVEA